jgi:hypothetical protein
MVKCNSEPYSTPYKESGCVNDQKKGKRKNWSGGEHNTYSYMGIPTCR